MSRRDNSKLRIDTYLDWIIRIYTLGTVVAFLLKKINTKLSVLEFFSSHWLRILLCVVVLITLLVIRTTTRYMIYIISYLFSYYMPYSLAKWHITYEYSSQTELKFQARFLVRSLQTGVDHIRTRYNWSGAKDTVPDIKPITTSGYHTKSIEYDGNEFGYNFYKVFLNRSINKGDDPVLIGVEFPSLEDSEKKSSPHLLTNVNVKTDLLIMEVVFTHDVVPKDIEFFEYIHATDDHHWRRYTENSPKTPIKIESIENNKSKVSWTIKNPIVGGKYVIRWTPEYLVQ